MGGTDNFAGTKLDPRTAMVQAVSGRIKVRVQKPLRGGSGLRVVPGLPAKAVTALLGYALGPWQRDIRPLTGEFYKCLSMGS